MQQECPESSTPTDESQVTAAELRDIVRANRRAWSETVLCLLEQAAFALEARDAELASLRTRLEEAEARRVPDGWSFGHLHKGMCPIQPTFAMVADGGGWMWMCGDEKGHARTWQECVAQADAAARTAAEEVTP